MSEVTVSAALVSAPSSNHLQKLSNIHATEKNKNPPTSFAGCRACKMEVFSCEKISFDMRRYLLLWWCFSISAGPQINGTKWRWELGHGKMGRWEL
jgi:hypothetical protein